MPDVVFVIPSQKACLRAYGRAAVIELARMLIEHGDELVDLAVQRSSGVGALEYGDASYDKTDDALGVDVFEELADAIFYWHIPMSRREVDDEATDDDSGAAV